MLSGLEGAGAVRSFVFGRIWVLGCAVRGAGWRCVGVVTVTRTGSLVVWGAPTSNIIQIVLAPNPREEVVALGRDCGTVMRF